jgi:transmembrane sensor
MDLKRHAAREEAAQWTAKLDRGLRQGEGALLRRWLRNSVNRSSILEIARRSSGPEVLALLAELIPVGFNAVTHKDRRGSLAILVSTAAAAGLVILGAIVLNDQGHWSRLAASLSTTHESSGAAPHPPLAKGAYSTVVGQQQQILLPDGSTIELNTDTSLVVTYSLHERDIWLPRGEASFRVASEPARPFFVRAGRRRRFQAAGTQFDVRVLTPDNIELIVSEGSVTVFDTPMARTETPALARLRSNMIFGDTTVEAPGMVELEPGLEFGSKVEASDLNDILAWQRGRIVFKGKRLEDVLTETHRYTKTRFILSDKELSDTRVIGDFRTGDIDDFLDSLRRNYLIVSQRDQFGRIVLSRLAPPVSRL